MYSWNSLVIPSLINCMHRATSKNTFLFIFYGYQLTGKVAIINFNEFYWNGVFVFGYNLGICASLLRTPNITYYV